jgi:3-deoxy-7-phosphoheptulonate synthase
MILFLSFIVAIITRVGYIISKLTSFMQNTNKKKWTRSSWRKYPIKQQPIYDDKNKLQEVEKYLADLPSLVYFGEAYKLRKQLKKVCNGEAFLLQGGDCAESFAEFNEKNLQDYFKVILQMTAALMHGSGKYVVKVGRIAGQFAKPRSADYEQIDGVEYPSYRGDMVNSLQSCQESRIPNPENLIKAYQQSGATLNYLRSLAGGGFSSLDNVNQWISEFSDMAGNNKKIKDIIAEIGNSVSFFKACGVDVESSSSFNSADFFVSHEALLLNYEEALTRNNPIDGKDYCCSAHMLWIGDRTRNIDEAHIEYMRGIANPIGMKVGPSMQTDDLLRLIETLNPDNEAGRLTLITRMGADKINELLPPLVKKVQENGLNVIWSCDPMHGNTEKAKSGYKTRDFANILKELKNFIAIHQSLGSYAGGIHIEMTGQNVTECIGGAQSISDKNLKDRYHSHCDPRLNGSQSLELAFLIAKELRKY